VARLSLLILGFTSLVILPFFSIVFSDYCILSIIILAYSVYSITDAMSRACILISRPYIIKIHKNG